MIYLLGVDIGTTNVKAALFRLDGHCAGAFSQPYPTVYPDAGRAEQDPKDWYDAAITAIRGALRVAAVPAGEIAALGFSGHIRSVAFLDEAFETLHPGIVWSDTRSGDQVAWLEEELAEEIGAITGNRAATNFALPNMLWLKRHHPGLFARTRYFSTPKDYLVYRFTGEWAGDASGHAGSLLVDISKRDWSGELLDRLDIPKESLPPLFDSTAVVGRIGRRAAQDTGLPVGVRVVVGGGDNDCAAIGAGAFRPGTTSISLGTAGIILAQLDSPLPAMRGELDIFPHVIPGQWYAMGMIPSAGMSLGWLKARLVDEALGTHAAGNGPSTGEWLASLQPPVGGLSSSDDLFFFPFLQGRGNPDKDADARGVFWGLSGAHANSHLVAAVMEGVGYCVDQCLARVAVSTPVDEVVCCGGGSASPVWMQMLANILARPVWTNGQPEVGALGAAILAGAGIGAFETIQAACARMTRRDVQYLPAARDVETCRARAERFARLSERLWGSGGPAKTEI